jgi:hypothetical protein
LEASLIELVKGYPCFTCSDVALAKKGVDPARPEIEPVAKVARRDPAIRFGGSLSAREENADTDGTRYNRVPTRGSQVDLSV